ncbi:DUF6489 family protein [Aeoliella sp. ICT_H6.2]|uniref:DUF6489 family protein n=1 Tax=Aeoliella straminimaris TaxID=2954799 RepID=A0A9X2F8F2_9BACT|nr:DUF6489 family protein [Aeoliella straminimaris]MCO6043568.1 DUF6489 family protein [Aeoliella straminimaris]
MKITINVDCTPEEARRFMGLPDVAPMQEAVLKELQEQMLTNVKAMQPAEVMKLGMPMGVEKWVDLQKQFWTQIMSIGTQKDSDS